MSLRIGRSSLVKKPAEDQADATSPAPAFALGQSFLETFEAVGGGVFWTADAAGVIGYLSPQARRDLLGEATGPAERSTPTRLVDLFEPLVRSDGETARTLPFALARRTRFEGLLVRRLTARGEQVWEVAGEAVFDPVGVHTGYRGILRDVTEQQLHAREKAQLDRYDPLTGLINRQTMARMLEQILTTYDAGAHTCTVMLLDLDRFKPVNDALGQAVGDALLRQVADRLVTVIGDREAICRLGDDEFQIVLRDQADQDHLGRLAGRIIDMLAQPYRIDEHRCTIGASIGIAISPRDGTSAGELTRNADLALHSAKRGGRSGFRFFTTDYLKAATERRTLEQDLLRALELEQFELHYQPVVEAQTDRVVAAEALLRWNHPERGVISPAQFIPLAEESGLIGPLGEFALRRGCADALHWPAMLRVAVNVSPLQFGDEEDFVKVVQRVLRQTGLPPERLELEITESVFLHNDAKVQRIFRGLKDLGVRLALDDFGTGYSSLAYLRQSPFDKLKIDQSFIRGATEHASRNRPIVEATASMAQALHMVTTAEGVETFDQLDLVRAQRVNYVQGYIYSPPLAADAFLALARDDWTIAPAGPACQRAERVTTYRAVGVVHQDSYQTAILRNLSSSGALVEGVAGIAPGDPVALDMGHGQIVVARAVRTDGARLGLAFEVPLVADGTGGLCTLRRVSSFDLQQAGLPPAPPEARPPGARRARDPR